MLQAGDGADALECLVQNPDLQLIVSDVRMPRVSGLELAERAEQCHPGIRIILVSGYFQEQTSHVRFLKKPLALGVLAAAVLAELQPRPG